MKPDDFDIYEIEHKHEHALDLGWYTLHGFSDRGARYQIVRDDHGTKLTYYRPSNWTQEDWDEFCNEMEEDIGGDDAVSLGEG